MRLSQSGNPVKPEWQLAARQSSFFAELRTKTGGARRDRTDDLLHAMQALSQLSYGPKTGDQNAIKKIPWQAKFATKSKTPLSQLAARRNFPCPPYGYVFPAPGTWTRKRQTKHLKDTRRALFRNWSAVFLNDAVAPLLVAGRLHRSES